MIRIDFNFKRDYPADLILRKGDASDGRSAFYLDLILKMNMMEAPQYQSRSVSLPLVYP